MPPRRSRSRLRRRQPAQLDPRAAGAKAHIPSTSQRLIHRSVNRRIYRQRNLVERFFNKLKHFRRIATRFDKLARNFLAAVALASARLWTRSYKSTT